MASLSMLTRQFCFTCQEETLHVGQSCNHCGTRFPVTVEAISPVWRVNRKGKGTKVRPRRSSKTPSTKKRPDDGDPLLGDTLNPLTVH